MLLSAFWEAPGSLKDPIPPEICLFLVRTFGLCGLYEIGDGMDLLSVCVCVCSCRDFSIDHFCSKVKFYVYIILRFEGHIHLIHAHTLCCLEGPMLEGSL